MANEKVIDEETRKTRFLDEIISTVQSNINNRFCECKDGWNNLQYYNIDTFPKYLAPKILKQIRNTIKKFPDDLKEAQKPINNDIKDEFTIAWNNEHGAKGLQFGQKENTLEKLISFALKDENYFDKVINQLPLPDGGHVDIYCEKDDECYLIELKQWCNTTNTPLYSLVEVLKNYYLMLNDKFKDVYNQTKFKKQGVIKKINLVILAPLDYFKDYGFDEQQLNSSWLILKSLIENMLADKLIRTNKKPNIEVCIKVAYIDFPENTIYQKFCNQIRNSLEQESADNRFVEGMQPISGLSLKSYYDKFFVNDNDKKLLQSSSWHNILYARI